MDHFCFSSVCGKHLFGNIMLFCSTLLGEKWDKLVKSAYNL